MTDANTVNLDNLIMLMAMSVVSLVVFFKISENKLSTVFKD